MPNKSEFVALIAERLDGDRKRAAAALDAVIATVYETIADGKKVAISGFGVFEPRERSARTARNPATGEPVQVAASRVPAFRPGAEFKAIASGARDFTQARTAQAQAAVTKAASRMRDAADAATATVKKASGKKAAPTAKKSTKKAAPAKTSTKKAAPAKKSTKKTAPAKKSTAKKAAPAKKSTAKKSTAKKSTAKKSTAKKSTAKKSTAKKAAKKK